METIKGLIKKKIILYMFYASKYNNILVIIDNVLKAQYRKYSIQYNISSTTYWYSVVYIV